MTLPPPEVPPARTLVPPPSKKVSPTMARTAGVAAGEHLGEAEDEVVAIDLQQGVGGKASPAGCARGWHHPGRADRSQKRVGKAMGCSARSTWAASLDVCCAALRISLARCASPSSTRQRGSPDPIQSGWGWRAAGRPARRAPRQARPRGAVGVDIEGPLRQVLLGKTGQVNFADRVEVDSRQIVVHLQAVIDRAHMEVVEIEQDAATAAPSQLGQKLGLPISPPVAGRRRDSR